MQWNDQKDAELSKLWDEGLSGSQIGKRMGGLSRCSILGRARRIGLPARISEESKAFTKPRKKPNVTKFNFAAGRVARDPLDAIPKEPYVYRETVVAPEPLRVPFEALEAFDRRCRYPHGESHPYTFCGLPVALGTSWCVHHLKAISPPLKAKIEAAMAEEATEKPRVLENAE